MATLPPGALMQRAAFGLATACARLLPGVYGSRLVVLAGGGDNGGDALHAAAILSARGASVTAITVMPRVHDGGRAALLQAGGRMITAAGTVPPGISPAAGTAASAGAGGSAAAALPGAAAVSSAQASPALPVSAAARDAIAAADLIIDGLLGIGGRGGLREPAAALAALAERSAAVVVAADLPSGVDADTGEVAGAAVRADVTITFGTWKPGLLVDPGASRAGAADLVDIGLGPYLDPPAVQAPQAAELGRWLPSPSAQSDKYRRGVLGVLAGSDQFTGAAVLCTGGAVRGGAGMVRLVSAAPAANVVRQYWPEAVITVVGAADGRPSGRSGAEVIEAAGRVQAWVAGPGLGTDDGAEQLLAAVLATDLPVLVDADGLTIVARRKELLNRAAPTLLTPHAGELARLMGADREEIEAGRLRFARQAASELDVTVLLKGSTTVVASPASDEPVLANPTGTSWLATAGSGDVLSGLAGSLLAQGLDPRRAAAGAAYLHGVAARLAADGAPIGAADLLTSLQSALRTVAARN